jgi:beta-lactamase superfamily II metal-dependent hydrolase
MMKIEMLPADHGDCLWIEYGEPGEVRRVLIDGGTPGTYQRALRARLLMLPAEQRRFELLIVSHVDADHIGGALALLKDRKLGVRYEDIWFNGLKHLTPDELGPAQGDSLTDEIEDQGLPWNTRFNGKGVVVLDGKLPVHELPGGLKLTLLSPTPTQLAKLRPVWEKATKRAGLVPGAAPEPEEDEPAPGPRDVLGDDVSIQALADAKFKSDTSAANGSSIAVLAEYGGKRVILAADAHAPVLAATIRRHIGDGRDKLQVDAVKLPHHGSRNNVSSELLELLDCDNYLFSTSGAIYKHPDQEAVARAIFYGREGTTLHFNYRTEFNEMWDDRTLMKRNGYEARYPGADEEGLVLELG